METNLTNFKADILKVVGSVEMVDGLVYRVMTVRDERGRARVSFQTWWKDENNVYNPGKGFFFQPRHAIRVAKSIVKALESPVSINWFDLDPTVEIEITGTQKYIITAKSDIYLVTIAKWWSKGAGEEWELGKSLSLPYEKALEVSSLLTKAGTEVLHVK